MTPTLIPNPGKSSRRSPDHSGIRLPKLPHRFVPGDPWESRGSRRSPVSRKPNAVTRG